MWVITYQKKPVKIKRLYAIDKCEPAWSLPDIELQQYITAGSKRKVIELYLHWFGFTWKERPEGVEADCILYVNCSHLYKPPIRRK